MIEDVAALPERHALEADICIVGAGAAGITLALELENSGLSVLLLESGGWKHEKATQALYEGSVTDERLHSPPHRYRQRRLGGTTSIWGGRCMPLDEIDFEARDYIPLSGWPIGLRDIAPFYPRANRLCEAGEFQYRAGDAFPHPLKPVIAGFNSPHFTTDTLERFSRPTSFAAAYGEQLSRASTIRVLLHANVTQIRFHPDRVTVESVVVRTLTGKSFTARARRFVLAAGGLEVARLLLANREVHPEGIGNEHDVLGRYYMCHIAGTVGTLKLSAPPETVWHGYDVSHEGIYCRRRLALTPEMQRKLQLGNFIARLHHPRITDPAHRTAVLSALQLAKGLISYEYGKRLHGEERLTLGHWLAHVGNVLRAPHEVIAFGHHMVRDRFLAKRKFPSIIVRSRAGHYSLDFHAEQQPSALSRITLNGEKDALGMPRINVDWRYTAFDIHTVSRAVELFAADIRQSGVGVFEYDPESIEREMSRYGAYGGHHLGTARMGSDPRTSVVDGQGCIHGLTNLYVAGGAVFPTSSQANPTLTIVALAARLAAHLKARAAEPATVVGARVDEPSAPEQPSILNRRQG